MLVSVRRVVGVSSSWSVCSVGECPCLAESHLNATGFAGGLKKGSSCKSATCNLRCAYWQPAVVSFHILQSQSKLGATASELPTGPEEQTSVLVTQLWVPGGAWALAPPGSGSDCRRTCGANFKFRSPRAVAVLQLETESGGLWTPVFQG